MKRSSLCHQSTTRPLRSSLWRGLMLTLVLWTTVHAKRVSGDFRLSGMHSEHALASFAVTKHGAKLQLNMTATDMYENERFLKFRLYKDTEWTAHLKVLTCVDKVRHAQHTEHVSFDYQDKQWKLPTPIAMDVHNIKASERNLKIARARRNQEKERPHYWYIVLDDCSLEQYNMDEKIPKIHFDLEIVNLVTEDGSQITHLSADEQSLTKWHTLTMLLSGFVSFLMVCHFGVQSLKANTVHVAVLLVGWAAGLDAFSSMCEIVHLKLYERNGVGSYFMDAVAAHMEAICDSLLILLLLSIGAGWTLPTDAIRVNPNETPLQKVFSGLGKPTAASPATTVALVVVAFHVILAQWGRTYNDDFESYHDLEHLPGKIIMILRIFLGFLLVVVTMRTRLNCTIMPLQNFYSKLAVLGFLWFQSLPLVTFFCNRFVPFYLRNPAVFIGSAVTQSSSLVMLAWLVTAQSTSLHQFSHMGSKKGAGDFTESLAGASGGGFMGGGSEEPRTWSFGKAKVRLD